MPTADQISIRALQHLKVLGTHVYTTEDRTEDLLFCYTTLNQMLDTWAAQRTTMNAVARTVHALGSGTASYTIGSGGTINQARPLMIEGASILDANGLETPIEPPLTVADYQAIPDKALTAPFPTRIYYDHGWTAGLGRIYVFPIPNTTGYSLVLYTPTALAQFADQASTSYTFPPGVLEAIERNLAIALAEAFDANPSEDFKRLAAEGMRIVRRANHRPQPAALDAAVTRSSGGHYDIRTDSRR